MLTELTVPFGGKKNKRKEDKTCTDYAEFLLFPFIYDKRIDYTHKVKTNANKNVNMSLGMVWKNSFFVLIGCLYPLQFFENIPFDSFLKCIKKRGRGICKIFVVSSHVPTSFCTG
ncbi:hypothetical protein POVWA2_040490 [Plasmodium ovale wallikeri]|uniref:Uncharacterized protein n=1 Tax=Plasmodium ovale wallikeri TaxID=864142 RepID=A0A1A8Z8Y8_PLAOA|nr:hypothetical protein POVWA1_041980 [Plasmodium ovale wallikeri]SBT40825.1 hypothetical protein POVWA2_040490 [Plasmodium ovale wallikeri]